MDNNKSFLIIPDEAIINKIYLIRNEKVMLDSDLAELYGVKTKRLNEQVKRNFNRFPEDFMFQLEETEFENLKSQIATSSWGGRRTLPYAFIEHGMFDAKIMLIFEYLKRIPFKFDLLLVNLT